MTVLRELSNMFAALKHLDTEVEINSAWEMIRENVKISAKESLFHFHFIFCLCAACQRLKHLSLFKIFKPLHVSA
jgi:hypothetical protein